MCYWKWIAGNGASFSLLSFRFYSNWVQILFELSCSKSSFVFLHYSDSKDCHKPFANCENLLDVLWQISSKIVSLTMCCWKWLFNFDYCIKNMRTLADFNLLLRLKTHRILTMVVVWSVTIILTSYDEHWKFPCLKK